MGRVCVRECDAMRVYVLLVVCALLPALVGPVGGEVVLTGGGGYLGNGGNFGGGGDGRDPVFVPRQATTLRAARGHSATLHCRVLNLGDKAVSWVRSRDLQILSHGGAVFTADARVSVPAPSTTGLTPSHALTIARLRDSDAGRYECQLNTEPKMSLFFDLIVLDEAEAAAVLASSTEAAPEWGEDEVSVWAVEGEVRVAVGGAAELACGARLVGGDASRPALPLDIRWLRDGKPLVLHEGCAVSRLSEPTHAESRLRVSRARPQDAGEYACAVGTVSATVRLIVVRDTENMGEMEAMQRDQWAGGSGGAAVGPVLSTACLLALMLPHFIAL